MAEVTRNVEKGRFEVRVDGKLAGWLDYRVGHLGVIALPHTRVEGEFEGQGLAGQLVRAALDEVRSAGYVVDPQCSYVQGWIDKHAEYADLVAPSSPYARRAGRIASVSDAAEEVAGVSPASDPRI